MLIEMALHHVRVGVCCYMADMRFYSDVLMRIIRGCTRCIRPAEVQLVQRLMAAVGELGWLLKMCSDYSKYKCLEL